MRSLFWRCIAAGLLAAVSLPAVAQEDAYHAGLRAHLQQAYGLSGGAWMLGATEEDAFTPFYPSGGVAVQNVAVASMPFGRALRFEVQTTGANPWDRGAYFPLEQAVEEGDALLLVVWLRGLSAERGGGAARSLVGENQPPYRETLGRLHLLRDEWQQWLLPLRAGIDLPLGQGQYGVQMGYMLQAFELGGLALINYGSAYPVEALPRSRHDLDYAGREAGAPWRVAAQARIEQHRKAALTVRVVDAGGQPVEGAEVAVALQRHAFGFGTAVNVPYYLRNTEDARRYREKIEDLTGEGRSFNYAVIENGMKWPVWEGAAPWFTATQAQTLGVLQALHAQGKRVRGHTLLWPSWRNLPPDLEQNKHDPSYLSRRVSDHIAAMAGHPDLQAPIVEWDVLNEPAHLFDLADAFGGLESIVDDYAAWFNEAATAAPGKAMYINEYSLISQGGIDVPVQKRYEEIIRGIRQAGGRIDGIGLQGHVHTPLAAPEVVYEILEEYAALADELAITEYDAVGVPEDLAADYLRDLLTIAFSHPAMNSFTLWGFWDGSHWRGDAALFREDWSLKPSGQVYLDLVFDQWWTREQGTTGASGTFATRGFLGDYKVTVRRGGTTTTATATLTKDGTTLEVRLESTGTAAEEEALPAQFALEAAYPNPFNPATTVAFALPAAAQVRLAVYDALGREVAVLADGTRAAGRHRVVFEAGALPSGLYLVRLAAGSFSQTRRVLLVK